MEVIMIFKSFTKIMVIRQIITIINIIMEYASIIDIRDLFTISIIMENILDFVVTSSIKIIVVIIRRNGLSFIKNYLGIIVTFLIFCIILI